MSTANPRLSPDARSVLSHGQWQIVRDGELLPLRGIHPGWLTDRVIAYLSAPEGNDLVGGFLTEYRGPDVAPTRLSSVRFNAIAMGGGHWAGTHTATRTTYTSRGDVAQDTYCPAISPDGDWWACLTGNNSPVHDLLVNGVRVASGEIDDKLSIADDGAVVFSLFVSGIQQTFGKRDGGPVMSLEATWDRYEVDPVVVLLPNGEHWVISHDDTRTLVRPWGSTWGYALPGSKTPHAAWHTGTGRLRVVGDLENRLLDVSLDLSAPRVDLSQPPPVEPPALEPITRPVWAGWFKVGSQFDPSGAWRAQPSSWAHVETAQAIDEAEAWGLAVVASIDVLRPSSASRVAAIWCQGPAGQGGDVDAVGRECRRALALLVEDDQPTRPPILAYVDDALPAGFPASADWLALQCYAANEESVEQAGQRFRAQLARLPNKPIVLIVQAWDRRTTTDGQGQPLAKVEALQALWPKLTNENSSIVGVLAFAWGRAGGGVAHPSVANLQQQIASSIPSVPEIVTIRDEEEPVAERTYLPNDAQSVNVFMRLADFFASPQGMKRTHGIHTAPRKPDGSFEDPGSVIPAGEGFDLDTRSLAVWYARYLKHFSDAKGDHEEAYKRTEADLKRSEEYRNAQGITNPQ